jgi:hypothetical protein
MAGRSHDGRSSFSGSFPAASVLQRKCACGNHTVAGSKCSECADGKMKLQRKAINHSDESEVPAFVPEALRASGQPIDRGTRSFFESRLGHDFSHVRVHTDGAASESAEALNAHAFTVDRHILFGAGKYSPGTSEGRGLLAHELTHVVQQAGGSGGSISGPQAEHEADQNSSRLVAGQSGVVPSPVRAGQVQRQKKKDEKKEKKKLTESEVKFERTGKEPEKKGDPVKDSFKINAEMTVPMPGGGVSLGAFSFLDELKLSGEGGFLGEPLGTDYEDLKLKLAMTMLKLELSNLKNQSDKIRRGKVTFGTTLTATGGPTFKFDPTDITGSLGLQLQSKFSATTANIIPSSYGKLTLGTSLSATGSVTQPLGNGPAKPKAEGKAGVTADYESPPISHPAATLGGLLGDTAKITAGVEGEASGSHVPELPGATPDADPTAATTTGKLGGGVSVGLTGKRKKSEIFLKLKLTGHATIDHKAGTVTTESQTTFSGFGGFVGVVTGAKF